MKIGVPRETMAHEARVALVPDSVARLTKAGHTVSVERGAGKRARFSDAAYEQADAQLGDAAAVYRSSDVVVKVQRPQPDEARQIRDGAAVISLLQPHAAADTLAALSERKATALSLERVPRVSRAQTMDVLSSQATIAGYKAVLLGASEAAKLLPMLTTAAGNIPPAKAFVIGAGVAGLQAIATARRLGAVVSGFDIRAAAREQVLSLGATFVGPEPVADAEAAGGYARAQTADEERRTLDALAQHIKDQDLVITTALIPGKPAPRLITSAMLDTMRAGAIIVDLAAEQGGNCEVTQAGRTVEHNGVTVIGPINLAGSVPYHASFMFSKNVLALLLHLSDKDGNLVLDMNDEITGPMAVLHNGVAR
ncbi:MAG: Re/Si-specific NAD(P)(+) transhydrogenase subunit alpha [Gemmatimonadaceae bacterium]